jgi:hypothetical protein
LFFVSVPITALTIYYPNYLHHLGKDPVTVGSHVTLAGLGGAVGLFGAGWARSRRWSAALH